MLLAVSGFWVTTPRRAIVLGSSHTVLTKTTVGIVTYVTLEVDKLTYAMIKPARRDLILAIPPPDKYVFPPKGCEELQKRLAKYKPEQLSAAREQFIRDAEDNYYCEVCKTFEATGAITYLSCCLSGFGFHTKRKPF